MNPKGIIEVGKKPVPKNYILYDSIYITFLKWPKYASREQMNARGQGQAMGWWEVDVIIKESQEGPLCDPAVL